MRDSNMIYFYINYRLHCFVIFSHIFNHILDICHQAISSTYLAKLFGEYIGHISCLHGIALAIYTT
ncbi:MAG: hypothetical protein WCG25_07910 [bacterium]